MKSIKNSALLLGLALLVPAFATGAQAEVVKYKVALKGADEVPANSSKGTGTAEISYDKAAKKLSWKVTYSGLTGAATAGHIHGPAEAGKNAGVVVPFTAAASPIEGSATLTDAQAADLLAGKYYINIHTAENKGGEIRGQLTGGK